MDFRYGEEHVELRQGVRRLLGDVASEAATRRAMESEAGWDPSAYARLTGEIGVMGLAVPEELDGAGYGVLELGIVLQETGRSLAAVPLLSSALAVQALLGSGDDAARKAYVPGLAAGELLATVAFRERGDWGSPVTTTAEQHDGGWTVTGTKDWVLDAQSADLLLVPAQTAEGLSLLLVDLRDAATTARLEVTTITGVDPTRRQARISLDRTPAQLLGTAGAAAPLLARVTDVAVVLLAAEQLGVAEQCLDMATEYAKTRVQFDRPIGSFQAVKHKLADVLLEIEAARSAVMFALWTADRAPDDLPTVAAIAGSSCSETALLAASENIQVHGGMGVTWEHPAHLYLKRATTDRQLFGDPASHLSRLADGLDLQRAPQPR
ncbi:MAG: putative acyl-CoA dehydrogenase [Frankiales bacterium]|nr:putative acyl-CoA dehydrogenase [Frankiales bacterium]